MENKAFLFPGQAAQYPGMGKDFYDNFAAARDTFEEADDLLSEAFSRLIFEGSLEELTLTKNSQLAIYIMSIAIWRTVIDQFPEFTPSVCAGLSLGEYTALTASGKIGFADGLLLVKNRAAYMHEACLSTEGTMQVILGLSAEAIEEEIGKLQPQYQVWVANLNCPGQVVIAGLKADVEHAAQVLKQKGAKRALPLEVSGAFHSGLMKSAQTRLKPKIDVVPLIDTSVDLVMNVPGGYVQDLEEIRAFLIRQVTEPVRWEQGIRAMMENRVDFYVEIGCGKTLSGMNKKIDVGAPTINIEKVSDLEALGEKNAAITK
jgi:[acyl-carrier-protein] S-malonyltransferase